VTVVLGRWLPLIRLDLCILAKNFVDAIGTHAQQGSSPQNPLGYPKELEHTVMLRNGACVFVRSVRTMSRG